ncbi:acyl-CoA thioesterase II [Bradyrhizobium sp. RT5a]
MPYVPEWLTAEELIKRPIFPDIPEFIRRYYDLDRPVELRPVEIGRYVGQKIAGGRFHIWLKAATKLPDDPALNMCALVHASDLSLFDAVMVRYGRTLLDGHMISASLDHAIWFHRPFRANEWLLYAKEFAERARWTRHCVA